MHKYSLLLSLFSKYQPPSLAHSFFNLNSITPRCLFCVKVTVPPLTRNRYTSYVPSRPLQLPPRRVQPSQNLYKEINSSPALPFDPQPAGTLGSFNFYFTHFFFNGNKSKWYSSSPVWPLVLLLLLPSSLPYYDPPFRSLVPLLLGFSSNKPAC